MLMWFLFLILFMCYIVFIYVKRYLYHWDETNLSMVYDLFDVLLHFIYKHFTSIFIKEIYLCFSFVLSLCSLDVMVILAITNEFGNFPSFYILWNYLKCTDVIFYGII
jgi:hypothetical protein